MLRRTRLLVALLLAGLAGAAAEEPGTAKDKVLRGFLEEFVTLTPGKGKFPAAFDMGSPGAAPASEKPDHKVTFSYSFALAKFEVTQELYETVMGRNPSRWKGQRNSVEMVSWKEANEFCVKVTKELRQRRLLDQDAVIRLPSEAEWEYACRAGSRTDFSFGDSALDLKEYAWFKDNSKGEDPPVGKKKANAWGLYDMHGYVWEWCQDAWHPSYAGAPADGSAWIGKEDKEHVLRSGSWADEADHCRSAFRHHEKTDKRSDTIGFRCVRARQPGKTKTSQAQEQQPLGRKGTEVQGWNPVNKTSNDKVAWRQVWGDALGFLYRSRRFGWVDVLVVVGLAGLLYGLMDLAHQWTGEHHASVPIDLSPLALPRYTFFSLARGLIAYVLSLGFTLVYGFWAAKDRIAERVLVPLLDILQSIPILGFLPGLVLALDAAFPYNNIGLELASIITIFTGQAWNITFSFFHSLRSIPLDQSEVATVYRFNWWQRFRWVELPFATIGLVWNSMMGMAGGWFFLAISEAFQLGEKDFRLPGLGSYMSKAVEEGETAAMLWAILAMVLMIVGLDQLLWRPVIVWAQKFRVEEGGHQEAASSWFLNWLRRSHILKGLAHLRERSQALLESRRAKHLVPPAAAPTTDRWSGMISVTAFVLLLALLAYGAVMLIRLLWGVSLQEWGWLTLAAGLTLMRVLVSTALGTLWAVPAGLAIGLSPRLSRLLQPVVQVVASFPAPMLFPLVIAAMELAGVSLGWGSILLMLLGTQWYILFNVVAGAMAIPADLREAARSYRITGWQRFRILYIPAIFPYLVTGWVTAAGGAWNASIVSEYVTYNGQVEYTWGLGSLLSQYAKAADLPQLAASLVVMATVVVLFNRTVWRRLYRLAEERFSLNK